MLEGIPTDITGLGIIAMIVVGTFKILEMALKFGSATVKARLRKGDVEPEGDIAVYAQRDELLKTIKEGIDTILPIIEEPVPNRPGEKMIWRETNGKLREEIRRLSVSIDALTEIIKDVRGAARESANESREARMASEKVLSQLLAG